MSDNYILGAGKLYFAPFAPGTETPGGLRYIGNTPGFTLGGSVEKTEHYSSDSAAKERDKSVTTQVTRSATITTDEISPENLAIQFLGVSSVTTHTLTTVTDEVLSGVQQGRYYQLGVSATRPAGYRGLTEHSSGVNIVVTDDASTPESFDAGDDYTIDMATGMLYIVPGGAIDNGTNLEVDYKVAAGSYDTIISGNDEVTGELKYIADNQSGKNRDVFLPKVTLSPNGEIDLKGTAFQQMTWNVEILKKSGQEAVYINGRKA